MLCLIFYLMVYDFPPCKLILCQKELIFNLNFSCFLDENVKFVR